MDCKVFRNKLNDYLSDDIPYSEKFEMKAHIKMCPKCAAIYDKEKKFDDCMYSLMAENTSPNLCMDIDKKINKQYSSNIFEKFYYFLKRNLFKIALPAAVILIGVFLINKYNLSFNTVSVKSSQTEIMSGKVDIENINNILAKYKYIALPYTGIGINETIFGSPSNYNSDDACIKQLYWVYCNELSKACGFDMTPYKGKNVTVYFYSVNGKSDGIMGLKCTAVTYNGKIIGIWLTSSKSWSESMALDNRKLKDITKMSWMEWLNKNKISCNTDGDPKKSAEDTIGEFCRVAIHFPQDMLFYNSLSKACQMNFSPFENRIYNPYYNNYLYKSAYLNTNDIDEISKYKSIEEQKDYSYSADNEIDSKILGRNAYEKRQYTLHCEKTDYYILVSKEEEDSPWLIDRIAKKGDTINSYGGDGIEPSKD